MKIQNNFNPNFLFIAVIIIILLGFIFFYYNFCSKQVLTVEQILDEPSIETTEPDSVKIKQLIKYENPVFKEIGMNFNSRLQYRIDIYGGTKDARFEAFRSKVQNNFRYLIKNCLNLDKTSEINISEFNIESIVYSYYKEDVFNNITYYFEFNINETNSTLKDEYLVTFSRAYCKNNYNYFLANILDVTDKFFLIYECSLNEN